MAPNRATKSSERYRGLIRARPAGLANNLALGGEHVNTYPCRSATKKVISPDVMDTFTQESMFEFWKITHSDIR